MSLGGAVRMKVRNRTLSELRKDILAATAMLITVTMGAWFVVLVWPW
jgi:hypothetical protein